jgi:hypothetical protein
VRTPTKTRLFLLALVLAVISACFTEVGNAEDEKLVSGSFRIDYAADAQPLPKAGESAIALPIAAETDSIFISQFYLNLREAEFKALDSVSGRTMEWHLWKNDSLTLPVDFTGKDTAAVLPTRSLGDFHPDYLVLECMVPGQAVIRADTLDFARFMDKGYIKGHFGRGKSLTAFLFQLPENREIHLEYSKEALSKWQRGNVYRCEFVFFATKWIDGISLAKAETTRDKSGNPLIILGNGHNPELYQALVERFYKSFNTQRVFAQVGR